MSAPAPIRYRIGTLPKPHLVFRTQTEDGRVLLSLIPDEPEQHPLDVVSVFLDEPGLTEWTQAEIPA